VVDHDNGQGVSTLKLAKEGEDAGDLSGIVFVDTVQADKWVEQQQARAEVSDRSIKATLVAIEVEPQTRCRDDVQRDATEVELSVVAERAQALLDEVG